MVLVVDDSESVRSAVRKMLEKLDYDVAEASDGAEALKICGAGRLPDAMLLDLDMPGMDGLSCLENLRQERNYDRVRVIMCTTVSAPQTVDRALKAGANEYIIKPFTEKSLVQKLARVGLVL